MTGKDDSNNPPNVAPWPVMSTVLLALAGPSAARRFWRCRG
ncbi:hypothetical protein ASALC70_01266 [Alcanivorax sp. ALC70]|nr:hypothetical protein ASALC70_01266 [Alcanivorax sp. ALC70]